MANYQNLLDAISAVIKTNNRREITGQVLQNVLNQMVGSLGENMQLTGFANPLTNPGTPDQNVFYFAEQAGVYRYFDNIELGDGFSVLMWKNGHWTYNTLEIAVTRQWVESNFVTIDFFRKLFRAYDSGGTEVLPNDLESIVQNIKATCGFWTEQYLSALGIGQGGSPGVSRLNDLVDVQITNPQNGEALLYNSTLAKWVNGQAGVTMSTVWAELADSGSQQINASHLSSALSSALSDMATKTWVNQQIGDMATKTWVGQNYISISFFNRLFKAYNGSTQVNPNDTTSTIDRIKAMLGFYTDLWVSALGTGGISGTGISLSQLNDVNVSGVTNNQVLGYNSSTNKWVPVTVSSYGGSVAWSDVTNKPTSISGYGITDCYISGGTIVIGSSSITPITSHQDLSAYATQSWVQNNFLGSGALSGYATTSWVEGNFYSGNGGRIWGNIHLQASGVTYGNYIVFGDRGANEDYVYIQENTSDHLLIYGYKGVTLLGGGSNGVAGRVLIESYSSFENYGMEITCSRDSWMRIASDGNDYGQIEITASHNVSLYTRNETAVVQLSDWSNSGGSWLHNAGAINILTTNGNITLKPTNGSTEVWNFVNRSDIRNKNVIRYMEYDLDIFAKAPLFSFTWKTGEDRRVRIGTSAQYWMDKIPETVTDITQYDKYGRLLDEHLSLDYITVAYAGMVTLSRVVSDHEARIKNIEKLLDVA